MPAKLEQKTSIKSSLQTRLIFHIIALLSLVMIVTTYVGIRRESKGIIRQMQKDGIRSGTGTKMVDSLFV